MADSKPSITATIKFRGVTIEGMTVEELRELRDMLNGLVADKFVPYPQPYPVYPVIPWYGTTTTGWTTTSSKVTLGNNTNGGTHYTLSCN